MIRKLALAHLRIAGYHDDSRSFVRLYVENRISIAAANVEWNAGQVARASGVGCHCAECKAVAS